MKKALIVATVVGFIAIFERNDIKLLQNMGYEVHVASNFKYLGSPKRFELLMGMGIVKHHIPFERSPFKKENVKAYKALAALMQEIRFDIVHCHTPVGGVLGRMAAHKAHVPQVLYTAHGFHFFKGAPLKNWFLYYPTEWICAHWTDVLITINKEDYDFARRHMNAKKVEYIPGVGIDLKRFTPGLLGKEERAELRSSIGIKDNSKMLLSVGELNQNKNHETVIRSIAKMRDKSIHYVIAGKGGLYDYLTRLSESLNIRERVHLLGYRNDMTALYESADLYIHPSLREGLSVALMEAIASKTPVICSNIRGNTDLIKGNALFEAENIVQISEKIEEYLNRDNTEEIEKNYSELKRFDIGKVFEEMKTLYFGEGGNIF